MKRPFTSSPATITAAIFAIAMIVAFNQTPAFSQGKTTTRSYTDLSRGVNVEETKDEKGNIIRERESDFQGKPLKETEREFDKDGHCLKETEKDAAGKVTAEIVTEYNKDGSVRKRTTRRFHPNGKKKSEITIIYEPDGTSRGTTQSWDDEGNPDGRGKGKLQPYRMSRNSDARNPLRSASFSSPQGVIRVNLPDDMAAGDTISGTVVMEPAGQTESERAGNMSVLNGYVLQTPDMPGHSTAPGNAFRIAIPAGAVGLPLMLMRDGALQEIIDVELAQLSLRPAPPVFTAPEVLQAGQPLRIAGPFDGDLANTSVQLGGRPAQILAESPRSMIVAAPQAPGLTTIEVTEGGQMKTGQAHNLAIALSAPKTALMKGEKTSVHVQVTGLAGLRPSGYPILVDVSTRDRTVIRLAESNGVRVTKPILPDNVDASGTCAMQFSIQGVTPGPYSIGATVTNASEITLR